MEGNLQLKEIVFTVVILAFVLLKMQDAAE